MSRNIGEVRVSVLPDGTRFKPEAEAALKKASAGLNASVKLTLTDDLRAKLEAAAKRASGVKATVKIDGDAKPLDAKLAELALRSEALQKSLGNLKVKDDSGILQAMAKQAGELRGKIDQIGDSNGADKAASQLQKMIDVTDKVRSALGKTTFAEEEIAAKAKEASAKVAQEATRQAGAYDKAAKSVSHFASEVAKSAAIKDDVKIKVKLDDTLAEHEAATLRIKLDTIHANAHVGLDSGHAEEEAVSLREKLKAIAGRVDFKAKLEGAPGVLAKLIGLRTAAELEGEKGGAGFGKGFISKLGKSALFQNPGITAVVVAGLAALPAALGAVATLGGIALGGGLVGIAIKTINKDLKNAQTQLQAATTKLAKDLKAHASQAVISQDKQTIAALNQQIALLQREQAAFAPVTQALTRLKNSFLSFAIVVSKPLIKPFTDALNLLSGELNGPLRGAFTSLFRAVGPLVKPVVNSMLEIVRGILPGMTDLLNKARKPLTDMFNGFGKIVGLRIGQWFRDAIPYMKDSVHYFLALINALGIVGSYLVKFGGETAKAFGNPALKGFGPSLERIANDLIKLVRPALEGWITVMAPVTKALLKLMVPILDFLANNPALVKAISAAVAAFFLFNKVRGVISGVQLALKGLGTGGVWGLVIAAAVLAVVEIIDHWKQITAFFKKFWPWILGIATGTLGILVVLIVKHWSQIAGETARIWGGIVKFFKGLWGGISHDAVAAWNGIFGFLKGTWGHIENAATGIFKPIASVVVGAWHEILSVTKTVWEGLWKVIKPIVLIIVGTIGQEWRGIRNLTVAIWHAIYNDIVGPMEATWKWLYRNFLVPIVQGFRNNWNAIVGFTTHTFSVIYHGIVSALTATWNFVWRNFLVPIGRAFNNIWTAIVRATTDTFSHIYGYISHTLSATWNWVYRNFLQPVYHGFINTYNLLKGWTQNTFNWMHDHIISPLSKAWSWIANTFVRGVKSAFSGLVSNVKTIWSGLKKVVGDPINFVGWIWNKFAGFVNKGLSIFGVKQRLPGFTPIKFAKGGHVPGYAPGRDIIPAMLSPGEFVMRPEAVKKIGVKTLHALNEAGAHPKFGKTAGHAHGGMTRDGHPYVPPGAPRLGNVGKGDRPGHPVFQFADGAAVERSMLQFMMSKRGQKYSQANRWGEPPWDCSSLVWQAAHNAGVPIPKTEAIANLEANWFRNSAWAKQNNDYAVLGRSQVQPGDIVFGRGASPGGSTFGPVGHVGMALASDTMISALGSKYGVTTSSIDGFQGAIRLGGPGGKDVLKGLGSAILGALSFVLKPLAQAALNGVKGLVDGAMNHIPGVGPIPQLAKNAVDDILNAAIGKITGNQGNYDAIGGGGAPPGGATGSALANGREMYSYLLNNLFGGHKIAAAGAIASIYGESGWNPFAQGTGGRGLIGWTPPGTISDAAFKGGMRTQLPEIIHFVKKNGDMGAIAQMDRATSVLQAANIWGKQVERYGINDVHPFGVRLATQIMQGMANGGLVQGKVFDRGGTLAPGVNTVYNLTGKPEHLIPTGPNGGNVAVTLEIASGGNSEVEQFLLYMMRKLVRVKGGGNAQKAFGRH